MPSQQHVRWGLFLATERESGQTEGEVLDRARQLTEAAERLGVDEVWTTEHHFMPDRITPSALSLAAYLLGRTRRIGVGTAVTLLPLYPAVQIAEQAALLDQLSGGRFLLGAGRGMPLVEYDVYGRGVACWQDGLFEQLDVVRQAWAGTLHPAESPADLDPLPLVPAPATAGGPPLWVAGSSGQAIDQAGERGVPLLMFYDKTPEAKAGMVARWARAAAAAGVRDEHPDHAFLLFAQVTDDRDHGRELMRRRAESMVAAVRDLRGARGGPDRRMSEEALRTALSDITRGLRRTQPVGSAEHCAALLVEHLRASRSRRVLLHVESEPDTASSLENLERLVSEVFPRVEKQLAVE